MAASLHADSGLLSLLRDARKATRGGLAEIERRQRDRFAAMVAFARARSPFYRELYAAAPHDVRAPLLLPPTSKSSLMARFDDWATDREITLERAKQFTEDPALVGVPFLGRYTLVTTSGTTGTRGIFVHDEDSLRVVNAMMARTLSAWLGAGDLLRLFARGGRMSLVMATDGHFASAVAAAKLSRRGGRRFQVLSAATPIPELVARLNAFQPTLLAPYASVAALLATEAEAGRLDISPVLLALSAEGLPASEYDRISRAFGARVGNSYASSEVPFLSFGCRDGWLHVNADWVLLEPVDRDLQPVRSGEASATVLVSNLANRVQPVLRYDLGDSVTLRPDPCPCGSPLPAIRVRGRAADVLVFRTMGGQNVEIPPLAFTLLLENLPGLDQFQIIQTAPAEIAVRLRISEGAGQDVAQVARAKLRELFASRSLGHVVVETDLRPPEQGAGGKYRRVIPIPA